MISRLILHIGANKTGSSAIQTFLSLNRAALQAQGIMVPNGQFQLGGNQGNQVFAFQELMSEPEAGRKRLESSVEALKTEAPAAEAILFSAENLTANPVAPSLFEGLTKNYDTQVIVFIRRQDEYLLSSWQQWYSKVSDDFWAWLISVVGQMGNWRSYLQNWEAVVPREKINVRIYDRSKLEDGDVIADFYKQLELGTPMKQLIYPNRIINPSYSDAIMEIVKGNRSVFKDIHDNEFYRFVRKVTGEKYIRNSRESYITFDQRHAILQQYSAANRWVRDHYFPGASGDLFSAPKESDYDYLSASAIEERKLEALTSMLIELYQRKGKSHGHEGL